MSTPTIIIDVVVIVIVIVAAAAITDSHDIQHHNIYMQFVLHPPFYDKS
jgi:hypothetical protein